MIGFPPAQKFFNIGKDDKPQESGRRRNDLTPPWHLLGSQREVRTLGTRANQGERLWPMQDHHQQHRGQGQNFESAVKLVLEDGDFAGGHCQLQIKIARDLVRNQTNQHDGQHQRIDAIKDGQDERKRDFCEHQPVNPGFPRSGHLGHVACTMAQIVQKAHDRPERKTNHTSTSQTGSMNSLCPYVIFGTFRDATGSL